MANLHIDEFIQLLRKTELSLAALYDTFATIIPASKEEWLRYADEERLHANWIEQLHDHVKVGEITFGQTKINSQAINTFIDHVERQIKNSYAGKIDLERALAIAIDIEKSLAENAFLKAFNFESAKAEEVCNKLIKATEIHKKTMIEWQKKVKYQKNK